MSNLLINVITIIEDVALTVITPNPITIAKDVKDVAEMIRDSVQESAEMTEQDAKKMLDEVNESKI